MTGRYSALKQTLAAIAGLTLLIAFVALSNIWLWFSEGVPTIPTLEGRWWAGYYETVKLGRQWCVARFVRNAPGHPQMVVLSPFGAPDTFKVERSTSNERVVHLTFTEPEGAIRIEAEQLYVGKRYHLERLMVGRVRDFWKMNDDVSIRGHFAATSPQREFAIEPIGEDALIVFWRKYVRPEHPTPGPEEILRAAGVRL